MRVIIFSSRRRRAASVRNYLLSQGIPDSSIIAIGYGKNKADRAEHDRRPEGRLTGACNSMSSILMKIIKKTQGVGRKFPGADQVRAN